MRFARLLIPWLAAAGGAAAADAELLSVAVRSKVSEERVLGKEQPVSFHAHDVAATWRLPWEVPAWAGWESSPRLLASAGVLRGAGHATGVVSALASIALARRGLPLAVELGAGLALLGKHDFPEQDYGGPLQFALTVGLSVPIGRRMGVGYRFMHYSDAGAYGRHSIGADFHMVEVAWRFR